MNLKPLTISKSRLYPIVVLDRILSHRARHIVHSGIDAILVILTVIAGGFYATSYWKFLNPELTEKVLLFTPRITGLVLILLAILLAVYLLEVFFRFLYFREGLISWRTKGKGHEQDVLSFYVLKILYNAKDGDVTKSFLDSSVGARILLRCGISESARKEFLAQRSGKIFDASLPVDPQKVFGLRALALFLVNQDDEFREFLFKENAREGDFIGAALWVIREHEDAKARERWWGRDRLAALSGIGKDWSYGEIYTLSRYAREVLENYSEHASALAIKDEHEVREIERILSRAQEANALLVGDKGAGTVDIIYDFAQKIRDGSVRPELEHKKVFMLSTDTLISSVSGKGEFEGEFLALLNEATRAENIIMVIPDLPSFISSARNIGSDVMTLLDPYLVSTKLQVIAVSDVDNFHNVLEQNAGLMTRFEKVDVTDPSLEEMMVILERVAEGLEASNSIFFTYSSIEEAFQSAQNYLPDGVLPDKAIDLLIEVIPQIEEQKEFFVKRSDILTLITRKTKIPVGEIKDGERAKLLNLERFLHLRVVGQDEAVNLVSNAMRRARAGVRNMKRPIGSFLFLGPTGVGKTETAKALAEAFFGDESAISRFDMSEYQTADALKRLIGNFEGGEVGTLTKVLKGKPYGLLLLDEFEKTNHEVLDLFLQILDEGFFSDMRGKRVNARNVIIIATSNAGSDLIWEAGKRDGGLMNMKDGIVNTIIERGIFKPELLNRFDAVVLFHPLDVSHLSQIARVMLERLKKRLHERGIDLVINNELVNAVIRHGTDPSFGARPMNRAIQEYVEQVIADKLVRGEIKEGSRVELSPEYLPLSVLK